ncbi:hypothetical protein SPRG_05109 [Saprolegnia parasitica CBS 223.65]|uniref:F-box domain-containing protein n=1 Tax=Saprolegnia parasitica (strain CBS 223.65) TaxID=695850 RepID=A0A067CIQ1_SAPPC|nr:hypothetical protein SPRG_05109 [Saprolegnia parasitica CBS 223.65]KDO30398.1 hypothetical protein SPRG_05109 [Saprolegnia parasitica CBS 223.65]|eukprot:XP_012199008.1 hypothetical protein SPRG_05109 [Saprolegnia parasitica CBS 223.65]
MATLPLTLRRLRLATVTLATFPTLPKLQKLDLWSVALTNDAFASIMALLTSSDSLERLNLADADLPKDQLETILYALPRMLVVAVLFLVRNTQRIWLDLNGDNSLDLAMCQRLLAAFRATSRMELGFYGEDKPLVHDADVTRYAALHGIEFANWCAMAGASAISLCASLKSLALEFRH